MHLSLFDPISIHGVELKNRIIFAPVVTNFGLRNRQALAFYAERARGGAGFILLHAIPVDLFLRDEWIQGLEPLIQSVHREGAKIAAQLWHGNDLNGQALFPSWRGVGRKITREEIGMVIHKFAVAARCCREAGFDGVEVHGAHGYFVNQFFSPLTNQRTDEYGGSVERRMRFAAELVRMMRKTVGDEFLLLYRHSAVDGVAGGATIEESVHLARALEKSVNLMDVSAGQGGNDGLTIPPASAPEGTHADLAGMIKNSISIPVVAVGRVHTPGGAERILREGKADLVALGRQLLADPRWPRKVREGRDAEIVFCRYCTYCTEEMQAGRPIACLVNPSLGREGAKNL
jgi:2,4-dienoyl-CoA reductase (NADPH2)